MWSPARRLAVPALAALLAAAPPLPAQLVVGQDVSRYEMLYGEPVDVSIDDLAQGSVSYERRAVRTRGRLDISPQAGGIRNYVMRGTMAGIGVVPVPEIGGDFDQEGMKLLGREVEITGVFFPADQQAQGFGGQPIGGVVQFWQFLGPPDEKEKIDITAPDVTLERLVTMPGRTDGKTIRIVGKFRGRNLYGDLPVKTQRNTSDWVIKDDLYAVWVSGRKPKGAGWELDATLKRDTGKWIEVIGRPETIRGVTYVRALKVALTNPPTVTADVKPPPPPPERPKKPPVVVFALPLDGEAEVAQDSRFVVQFSKDMDEATFTDRVLLRYAGPALPGDREFVGLRLTYDRGRRALTVDPGDTLRPRREVELLLLPGIADIDGLTLIPRRPAVASEDAVDVLRYLVGS